MMTECSPHLDLSNDNTHLLPCMYIHTTKMAVHPSHKYNQTSQKTQNGNKIVNRQTSDIGRRIELAIVYSKDMLTAL